MLEKLPKRGVLPDLVLTNREGLVEDIRVESSNSGCDHEKTEYSGSWAICTKQQIGLKP